MTCAATSSGDLVTPGEARRAAGSAASSVESGEIGIADLYRRFNGLVGNRSSDETLSGDYLRLFQALEAWMAAVGDRGVVAEARYGWLCSWNPTTVPNGFYVLVSEAFNQSGHVFSDVSVTINNR